MTRPVILRSEAEEEVEAAFAWYEEQQVGLGAEFLRAVDAALAAVFFVVQDDVVEVIACIHARRHPRRWRARVE